MIKILDVFLFSPRAPRCGHRGLLGARKLTATHSSPQESKGQTWFSPKPISQASLNSQEVLKQATAAEIPGQQEPTKGFLLLHHVHDQDTCSCQQLSVTSREKKSYMFIHSNLPLSVSSVLKLGSQKRRFPGSHENPYLCFLSLSRNLHERLGSCSLHISPVTLQWSYSDFMVTRLPMQKSTATPLHYQLGYQQHSNFSLTALRVS